MTNMTFAVPEDLYEIMKKHTEIKWSEIARKALWDHAKRLEIMDKLLSKSKLSEDDVLKIAHKIKKGIAQRHGLKE